MAAPGFFLGSSGMASDAQPRDKGKVEGAVLIVERWILARPRHRRFFSLADLNAAIAALLEDLNNRPMRRIGKRAARSMRPYGSISN
jgi:transposase